MKKTLIALALASLSTASMADVILYGQIKGGVETTFGNKLGQDKNKGTTTQIVDYGSRIGFKGHEHLTDNLDAIWQVESKVDIGGGSGRTFGTRDSFIGLKGGFGTVKVGYQQTPIKELNGKLDQWEYDSSVAGLGTFTRGTDANRRATAVSYETPDLSGFTAKAYYSPSEQENGESTNALGAHKNKAKGIYGLSASYKNSGFFADVAGVYARGTTAAVAAGKKGGYQALVQAGYESDKWLAGLAYQRSQRVERANSTLNADADKVNELALSGAYTLNDALTLKGTFAYGFGIKDINGDKIAGNGKYYQGLVGADYALSKRTIVNGQYGYLQSGKGDDKLKANVVSIGMKHKF
ncbi:porin [Kingella oralis]|jgi:hypothetical protein|uniref:Gram-negative porin n=1 Tax=Kingella oralis ATCC 51147 TaxID=629741 RepID=C4GN50_9NEIS|nr:porin [Kingella oralis]EEP66735.1 Gram-negative porin [Kingella oralis ATCC 51147]QMT42404.1 porin [Kingella oralis]